LPEAELVAKVVQSVRVLKVGFQLLDPCWGARIECIIFINVRIEEFIVVLTLLDGPDHDEDDDVEEVLLHEQVAHLFTDAGSVEAAVGEDSGEDGDDDVNRESHREHQVALILDRVDILCDEVV